MDDIDAEPWHVHPLEHEPVFCEIHAHASCAEPGHVHPDEPDFLPAEAMPERQRALLRRVK